MTIFKWKTIAVRRHTTKLKLNSTVRRCITKLFAYLYYSFLDCTIPEKWSCLKEYLNINGLDEVLIRGDGLCLLNAICESSYMDHNIPLSITALQKKILNHLQFKGERYLPWYDGTKEELIGDVQEFFSEKKYNTQGVDLIVFIAAEVLALDIRIFQEEKSTGYRRITQTTNCTSGNFINLKFSCNSHSSVENHYDSICQMKTSSMFPITQQGNFQNTSLEHGQIFPEDFSSPIDLTTSPSKGNLVDSGIDLTWSPPPPTPPEMSSDIEELGSYSNSENDEEVDAYLMKMRQGVSFPFHFLKYINEEEVDRLPPEINGSRKYKIKATISNYTELVKDRRWFKMSRSTVADPQTLRRVGKCGGSFVCNNKTCSFLSTQGEKNTSKFLFSSGVRVCHSCGNCATSTPCYARKLVDFKEKEGYVYVSHLGRHTCTPKVDRKKYDVLIRKEIQKNTTLPPKKLKLKLIKEKVGEKICRG